MDPFIFLLVLVVAVAAFAAGYFIGHFKALADVRGGGAWSPGSGPSSPLPGPEDGRYADASSSAPSRPRGAPPPASAGGGSGGAGSGARRPPQRSTKPPPAIAGLMGRITGGRITGSKRDNSPK